MEELPNPFYTFPEAAEALGIPIDNVIKFAETSQIVFHCLGDWEFVEFKETQYRQLTTVTQDEFSALVAGQKIVLEVGPCLSGKHTGCPTVKITLHPDPKLWVIDGALVRTLQNNKAIPNGSMQEVDCAEIVNVVVASTAKSCSVLCPE